VRTRKITFVVFLGCILNNYPEYFKKIKYVKSETSSLSDKPKRKRRRKGLFVDTSY